MSITWKEVTQFNPKSTIYYQKQQGVGFLPARFKSRVIPTPSSSAIQKLNLQASGLRIPNRQQLSQLIQCLAISETQKMQLEKQVIEATREKGELNNRLEAAVKAKEDILKEQKNSHGVLEEANSILAVKSQEVEALQLKLKKLEDSSNSKIVELGSGSQSQSLENVQPTLVILEERLNQIQNDIKIINSKILTRKDKDSSFTATSTANTSKVAVTMADDISLSSTVDVGSKSAAEDLPSLELLLRKILKSRKVWYKDPLDEKLGIDSQPVAQNLEEKTDINVLNGEKTDPLSASVTPVSALSLLEQEISESRQARKRNEIPSRNHTIIVDETRTRNVATSPPNESYLAFADNSRTVKKSLKKSASKKTNRSIVHNVTNSSCACATCSGNISWICPECITSETSANYNRMHNHSITLQHGAKSEAAERQHHSFASGLAKGSHDASALFANDTSMIRPLVDVVSEIELNPNHKSFALANDLDVDNELLEVISSLNGI